MNESLRIRMIVYLELNIKLKLKEFSKFKRGCLSKSVFLFLVIYKIERVPVDKKQSMTSLPDVDSEITEGGNSTLVTKSYTLVKVTNPHKTQVLARVSYHYVMHTIIL